MPIIIPSVITICLCLFLPRLLRTTGVLLPQGEDRSEVPRHHLPPRQAVRHHVQRGGATAVAAGGAAAPGQVVAGETGGGAAV